MQQTIFLLLVSLCLVAPGSFAAPYGIFVEDFPNRTSDWVDFDRVQTTSLRNVGGGLSAVTVLRAKRLPLNVDTTNIEAGLVWKYLDGLAAETRVTMNLINTPSLINGPNRLDYHPQDVEFVVDGETISWVNLATALNAEYEKSLIGRFKIACDSWLEKLATGGQ